MVFALLFQPDVLMCEPDVSYCRKVVGQATMMYKGDAAFNSSAFTAILGPYSTTILK